MIRISPDPLWIGHGGEGHDFARILDLGIEAVVELAVEEPPFPTRRELIACRFPLIDGTGNRPDLLVLAVRTVAALVASGVPTLVCCGGGLSRSPAVAAAALAVVHGESPAASLERVTAHHPSDVSPGFWAELVAAVPRAIEPARPPARA
jgi:protein-tyrosine phosphatase